MVFDQEFTHTNRHAFNCSFKIYNEVNSHGYVYMVTFIILTEDEIYKAKMVNKLQVYIRH